MMKKMLMESDGIVLSIPITPDFIPFIEERMKKAQSLRTEYSDLIFLEFTNWMPRYSFLGEQEDEYDALLPSPDKDYIIVDAVEEVVEETATRPRITYSLLVVSCDGSFWWEFAQKHGERLESPGLYLDELKKIVG